MNTEVAGPTDLPTRHSFAENSSSSVLKGTSVRIRFISPKIKLPTASLVSIIIYQIRVIEIMKAESLITLKNPVIKNCMITVVYAPVLQ